jgi:hypothetical protein
MKSLLRSVGGVMNDELAGEVIERPQHRDLLGLPGRRYAQVLPDFAQARAR